MLLALDTSTSQLGMALYGEASVLGELCWTTSLRHTHELAPALQSLLARCGKAISDVQAIGVAIGPGSFTSLRVGLTFSKGLALARSLPIVGIPTLDITARGVPNTDRKLIAVLQAGRGRLAVIWYEPVDGAWKSQGAATVMTAAELESMIDSPVMICGELSAEDRHHLARRYKNVRLASPAQCVRRPALLAELAWEKWQSGQVDSISKLAPIYLHTAGGVPA